MPYFITEAVETLGVESLRLGGVTPSPFISLQLLSQT